MVIGCLVAGGGAMWRRDSVAVELCVCYDSSVTMSSRSVAHERRQTQISSRCQTTA